MIGSIIKEKRIEKGWSQEELARRMGYKSRSTINKIELNINDVAQSTIVKFAEVLETNVSYLMGYGEEKEKAPELSETKKALIAIIEAMSEEDAAAALRLFRR